jgi:mannose-6-phosphate isomerase
MFAPLEAPMKDFAWGSIGAISAFRGQVVSSAIEAEQWFGGHPRSGTRISRGARETGFSGWLDETGIEFPLLAKLLAAAQPLSIQVHPSDKQAREGFAAEEERVPSQVPETRNYSDPSAKPELIICLSPQFRALVGFITVEMLAERLVRWEKAGLDVFALRTAKKLLDLPLREGVEWALSGDSDVAWCVAGLSTWSLANLDPSMNGEVRDEHHVMSTLATAHPGDPGILFGLLMHHVSLAQGEALFVDAGVVHAYLEGMGLEVMLPSDNVIRAGLTTKYIDRDEFLSVASLEPISSPPFVVPQDHGDSSLYSGFPAGFRVYKLSQGGSLSLLESHAIVFSDGARGSVSGAESSVDVTPGQVFFVTASEAKMRFEGEGALWIVCPGGKQP